MRMKRYEQAAFRKKNILRHFSLRFEVRIWVKSISVGEIQANHRKQHHFLCHQLLFRIFDSIVYRLKPI